MLRSLIFPPLGIVLIASYSLFRLDRAYEFELIGVNLLFILFMLFPRLRSRLLRRRTLVNSWLKEGHWLRKLLQGGSIYLIFQLIFVIPVAFIFLIELHLITIQSWFFFIPLAALVGLAHFLLHRSFQTLLQPMAASVVSRELASYLFMLGAGLIFLYQALYTDRPDLSDRSLHEALLYTQQAQKHTSEGLISDLIFMFTLKENAFWWTIVKIPQLLSAFPQAMIWLAKTGLVIIYTLYQLSVVYAFGQYFAGVLEFTDPQFYLFMKGRPRLDSIRNDHDPKQDSE